MNFPNYKKFELMENKESVASDSTNSPNKDIAGQIHRECFDYEAGRRIEERVHAACNGVFMVIKDWIKNDQQNFLDFVGANPGNEKKQTGFVKVSASVKPKADGLYFVINDAGSKYSAAFTGGEWQVYKNLVIAFWLEEQPSVTFQCRCGNEIDEHESCCRYCLEKPLPQANQEKQTVFVKAPVSKLPASKEAKFYFVILKNGQVDTELFNGINFLTYDENNAVEYWLEEQHLPPSPAGREIESLYFQRCHKCQGDGYTSEHNECSRDDEGQHDCSQCPIQVQCEDCQGKGFVSTEAPLKISPPPVEKKVEEEYTGEGVSDLYSPNEIEQIREYWNKIKKNNPALYDLLARDKSSYNLDYIVPLTEDEGEQGVKWPSEYTIRNEAIGFASEYHCRHDQIVTEDNMMRFAKWLRSEIENQLKNK